MWHQVGQLLGWHNGGERGALLTELTKTSLFGVNASSLSFLLLLCLYFYLTAGIQREMLLTFLTFSLFSLNERQMLPWALGKKLQFFQYFVLFY